MDITRKPEVGEVIEKILVEPPALFEPGEFLVERGGLGAGPDDVQHHADHRPVGSPVVDAGLAAPALLLPASRPGRPDNSGRAKALKGTIAQELSREGGDPFKLEMSFNGATTPRTILKMKLADFVAMQEGKLNGQEAFMTGRLRIEGDMAFMMQVAALTA